MDRQACYGVPSNSYPNNAAGHSQGITNHQSLPIRFTAHVGSDFSGVDIVKVANLLNLRLDFH
jgi:hypothetical protein